MSSTQLLQVKNLNTRIFLKDAVVEAVRDFELEVFEGEILCIIGESGCGKTMSMLSLTNLLPPAAKITSGQILFCGSPLALDDEKQLQAIRGSHISYIFQDPSAYLNPLMSIGEQIHEALRAHSNVDREESKSAVLELLHIVGLTPAQEYFPYFPHQLSGGMNQRAMIAMAIASKPQLLIADEPTSSLDRITEIKILRLLLALNEQRSVSIIFITHNISIIKGFAHRVAIMYAGSIVEMGTAEEILNNPQHPYTIALLACVPQKHREKRLLATIQGNVPELSQLPNGCTFHPRCDLRTQRCDESEPRFTRITKTHLVKCCLR